MREFLLFIRYLPAFYGFWKEWRLHPETIDYELRQYSEVISDLTYGKLSKTCYSACYLIEQIREHLCDDCELKMEAGEVDRPGEG